MMQAEICLRQDTVTTLPEFTEEHRIRQKEEELSGLESVHMAESETVCAAPGLDTLEPECVTAHCGVSDVHHTHTPLIKTETDLGSTHTGDLFETVNIDNKELRYVTRLQPNQIKTETDDVGYLKAEHIGGLLDIKCVNIKTCEMKCESSESIVSDLMNTVVSEAAVDHKDQIEPWQCAGESEPNCKKEINDVPTKYVDVNHHCEMITESGHTRIVQKITNNTNKHNNFQGMDVINQHMINNSSKNQSLLNFRQKNIICRNNGATNTGQKRYKCSLCEKCFNSKSGLKKHLTIHTGEKPYKCSQCEKCFNSKSGLKAHLTIHTGEKPYKCSQCGKCFSSKSNLNSHQQIHTDEKRYKCSQCGKCFNYKSSFNRHLRIHTGEKPYKCFQCGKCFAFISSLNIHQRIHTGRKPYKCSECGKTFKWKYYYKAHKIIHSGERPFKCSECEQCFNTKYRFNQHKTFHIGKKSYGV
ncbi:zinc finger protein 676-like isoform X4 [Anguilla anguilla]|uniref:zinc finger protein 676-like isoform X4 n=1 Tax=Anguilla anguilla TaxID=7936 RepID=UPI0015A9B6BD|nr:zinc finger protein 676-like isoform X4 [Anguilla anguilla]